MSLWRAKFGSFISNTWASSAGQWQEAELFSSSDFICDASDIDIVCLVYEMGQMQPDHWLSHAVSKLLSGWPSVGRVVLKATHTMDRQNCCYGCWYLSFTPPKEGEKIPTAFEKLRYCVGKENILPFFFSFSMNKNVSFTFGLALTCSCWLSWSCTSSLLSSATHGPGLADLDFPQTGMPALQPRPEAAEASWFWGPWHQLFRLLDTLSIMLLFDLFGPE